MAENNPAEIPRTTLPRYAREAAELALQAGAARRVADLDEALTQAQALLGESGAERALMAEAAQRFAAAHRGAAERMAARILDLLPARG